MSLDRVKEAVLAKAKAEAERIAADADKAVERAREEFRKSDAAMRADALRDCDLRLARETSRQVERERHQGRLRVLTAKNEIIEGVFGKLRQELEALPPEKYLDLVAGWLRGLPAGSGGGLRVNPKDEQLFAGGLDKLNAGRSGADLFTGVKGDSSVTWGALVDGADFTVDCTVDRKLAELRESSGELARLVFGGGK